MKWPERCRRLGQALVLTLFMAPMAGADNCSSLSDCYNSANDAAAGGAGAGAAGFGYYYYKKRGKRKKSDPCGHIREEMASIVDALSRLSKDKQAFQEEYQSEREALKDHLAVLQKNYDDAVTEFERIQEQMREKLGAAFESFWEKTTGGMKGFSADDDPSEIEAANSGDWIKMYEAFKEYEENVALEERYKELRGLEDDLSKQIQDVNRQMEQAEADYRIGLDRFNNEEAALKRDYEAASRSLAECEKAAHAAPSPPA